MAIAPRLAASLLLLASMNALGKEAPPEPPEALATVFESLPEEKLEYLMEEGESFAGTWRKLYQRLEGKTAEEVEAFVDALIYIEESSKFDEEKDLAAIPLATESPDFNSWKVMRPKALDPKREPGPINLSYYASNYRGGIRTFANSPVAVYPEDLVAGNVDIAIVGAPLDMGTYYRGQRFGPQAMRNGYYSGGSDMATMVNPNRELIIVDYGDIAIDNMSTEISVHHVRERVMPQGGRGGF